MNIKPTLTFSCTENWDEMKIGLVSRYCENCKRDVIDFTTMSRSEILQYLLANRNNKVCGRILKSQLDYHYKEVLITIQSYIKKNSNSNLSFYLLAISAMMLLSCSSNNDKGEAGQKESIALVSDATVQIKEPDSSLAEDDHRMDSLLPGELSLVGDLVIDDSLLVNDPQYRTVSGVRIFAEVMPEFKGSIDSLMAYFGQNLRYPEWEKKAGIQGNVFVSFTVDEKGKVIDPMVIRSVSGSRNFDSEVLRLMNEMPRWKPGKQDGKNVAVQMVLPIKFKL